MRIVAIIPARGGSKGIPRKNLQLIDGKTLVELRVIEAFKSKCTEVIVSTDDAEIAEISIKAGAKVISRPKEIATDEASTESVLIHACEELRLLDQDFMVLLQPTSPFITYLDINKCIETLTSNDTINSAITLRMGHDFIWRFDGAFFNPFGHERTRRMRRQELPIEGTETGGCYAIRISEFKKVLVRFPAPTAAVPVNIIKSIDIDTVADLDLVRSLTSAMSINSF